MEEISAGVTSSWGPRMKTTIVRTVAAVAAVLLGLAGLSTLQGSHEIALTAERIQQGVDLMLGKELPIKGPAKDLVTSLRADAAAVRIENGRIDIAANLQGKLVVGKRFYFSARLRGAPRYEDGAFYFEPEDVELSSLSFGGDSKLASALKSGLAHLSGGGAVEEKTREIEEAIKRLAQGLAKSALQGRPLYRLKDDVKGETLRATLERIEVLDDRIVVRFTLWRATAWAALGALGVLGGLAGLVLALRARPAPSPR